MAIGCATEMQVGRALFQFAQRLPHTKAQVKSSDGTICIEFGDGLDSFKIALKSRQLRDLLHAMEPIQAGDQLANEYENLNSARRRTLNAVLEALGRHGYFLDSYENKHVGREIREFELDLGESHTNAIQQSGEEFAIRQVLGDENFLADEAISFLSQSKGDVQLTQPSLKPSVSAVVLPSLTKEQIALFDEHSELLPQHNNSAGIV